jgi:hypothetical protein
MKTTHLLRACGALALLVLSAVPSRADGWSPLGFAIAQDRNGGSIPAYDVPVYGFRLGLFTAANRRMYGLGVSLIGNPCVLSNNGDANDGDVAGFQIAGVFNEAQSARYGAWQISGVVNLVHSDGKFVQIAGLLNRVEGDGSGVQIAGFGNGSDADFAGLQIAGVLNLVEGNMSGVQIAGVGNLVLGHMSGVQIGFCNWASSLDGIQIGAFNFVEKDFSGVQLGGLNADSNLVLPLLRITF